MHVLACVGCSARWIYAARTLVAFLSHLTHLPFHCIPRPGSSGFHQCASGPLPGSHARQRQFFLISTHQTQRQVDGVFSIIGFIRVMVAGEHQFQMAGNFGICFKNGSSHLSGKWHNMWSYAFCATTGETDFLRIALLAGMVRILFSDLSHSSRAKRSSAGADKLNESQHHRQPC